MQPLSSAVWTSSGSPPCETLSTIFTTWNKLYSILDYAYGKQREMLKSSKKWYDFNIITRSNHILSTACTKP